MRKAVCPGNIAGKNGRETCGIIREDVIIRGVSLA